MKTTLIFLIVVAAQVLLYFLISEPKLTGKVLLLVMGFAVMMVLMFAAMIPLAKLTLWAFPPK